MVPRVKKIIILVEEDDVGFPDFAGHDTNDGDATEVARFPAKLIILPQLHSTRIHSPLRVTQNYAVDQCESKSRPLFQSDSFNPLF